LRLTAAAEALLAPSRHLREELEILFSGGVFDPAISTRRFTIGLPDYILFGLSSTLALRLRESAPLVTLTFVDVTHRLREDLAERRIDLAVCGDFGLWPDIRSEPLFRDRLLAVCAQDHPLAVRDSVTSADLSVWPEIGVDYGAGRAPAFLRARLQQALTVQIDQFSRINTTSQLNAIMTALHPPFVAHANAFLAAQLLGRLPLVARPIDDLDEMIPVSMFWHDVADGAAEQRWLRHEVRAALEEIKAQMGEGQGIVWTDRE
jgi:DNA-binding transcriptional LysR family regulator